MPLISCLLSTLLLIHSASATARATSQRFIPKLNQNVTFLGLGCVELGRDWGIDVKESVHLTENDSAILLKDVLKTGINVIDTATSYQLSEERIGKYIPQQDYNYLLITKPGEHSIHANDPKCKKESYDHIYCRTPGAEYDFSAQTIKQEIFESLKKLQVKKLDVALLHLDSHDAQEVLEKGEALNALKELKQQGIIRAIGVSINGPTALYAVQHLDIDMIEVEYNLLNQTNEEAITLAHQKGIGVIIRGGLGTGLLTPLLAQHINDPNLPFRNQLEALLKIVNNDYQKLMAVELAFLYSNPNISTVIIGADKVKYMQQDIDLLNQFKDFDMLEQAKKAMQALPSPSQYTEIMGEFYANQKN